MKSLQFIFLFLSTLVLIGCEHNSLQQPIDADPLVLTFFHETNDNKSRELSKFELGWDNSITLQNAISKQIAIEGNQFGAGARTNDETTKNIVVFMLMVDETKQRKIAFAYAFNQDSDNVNNPKIQNSEELHGINDFRGQVYGFFIDGIGNKPTMPVDLRLWADDSTLILSVLPEQNTLKAKAALKVDDNLLGLKMGESIVSLTVQYKGNAFPYLPFIATKADYFWHATALNEYASITYGNQITREFDFNLFFIRL